MSRREASADVGGGGGTGQATRNGIFTVASGETGNAKVLPLTGITLSGRCEVFPPPLGTGDGQTRVCSPRHGYVDPAASTCSFLWEAVETPN